MMPPQLDGLSLADVEDSDVKTCCRLNSGGLSKHTRA